MCNGVQDCVDGADEEEVLCKLFWLLKLMLKVLGGSSYLHNLRTWVVKFPVMSDCTD